MNANNLFKIKSLLSDYNGRQLIGAALFGKGVLLQNH